MFAEDKFLQIRDKQEVWQRYCGFLDLSVEDFMEIQENLLLDQINLIADSSLGRKMMKGQRPSSVEEFRKIIPLTKYNDYIPYLSKGQEDFLAKKPYYWVHTSNTKGTFKRVPWNYEFHKVQLRNIVAALILASATQKKEIRVEPGCRILALLPKRPFVSAQLAFGLVKEFSAKAVPPLEIYEELPFPQKIRAALRLSMSTNIDYVVSMTSTFVPMQREFRRMMEEQTLFSRLPKLHPAVSLRLLGSYLSKIFKQNRTLLPKNLWAIKGIVVWGADSDAFRDTIQEQWGKTPFQFYGSSESGLIAMQDWRKDKMTFLPDSVFLEFIPEDEINREDGTSTVLLDKVEEGRLYEPVITSFYGMPFLRYRQGDLIKVVSSNNRKTANTLPQVTFHSRADDVIDLFGIARLNTETLSEALKLTGIAYGDWAMRKEYKNGKLILELYVESGNRTQPADLERDLHKKLKYLDSHYREAIYITAYNPVSVIPLHKGTFQRYSREKREDNNAPDLFKLQRMNLSDSVARELIQMGLFRKLLVDQKD